MKYNKLKCKICQSSDIIMVEKPEESTKPLFICRSCNDHFTYGYDGGEYADYVRNRELNKKDHEKFVFKTLEEYTGNKVEDPDFSYLFMGKKQKRLYL
jgi:hypothetical protein